MRWSPSANATAIAFAILIAGGCGPQAPPGTFVGESAHFRLFVDPALGATSLAWAQATGLAALETEWSDVETMLKMPDGKITYYWLTDDDVRAACGDSHEGACTWEQRLEIDSPALPNAHELTHAYMYLRKQRHPIPFLAEGMAESIACDGVPNYFVGVPWPGVVATEETSASMIQGGAFLRSLIRRFGIDAVLRYYDQGPERRDPALFAANFESFWGVALDDAWRQIDLTSSGTYLPTETKICPCSLPPLVPGGPPVDDRARVPYWRLPDAGGASLALTGMGGNTVQVLDCAGSEPPIEGEGVLARLDASVARRYVLRPLADVEIGAYVTDDCASVAPYTLGPGFFALDGLTIAVTRPPAGRPPVYVEVVTANSVTLRGGAQEICPSCAFDQGACQPSNVSVSLMGTTFVRLAPYASTLPGYPDVAQAELNLR